MLSGIETAALALAIFPLLIAALEHYKAGLEPLKTFSHYKLRLNELKGDLAFHRAKFLQSLTLLLERCVRPKALGALLIDPLGCQWKDQDLEARLSKCLGNFEFAVFVDVVADFKSTLEELVTRLDVDENGKPKWSNKDAFERAFDRIRYSFLDRDKIKELKKRLKEKNKRLSSIAKSSVALAPYLEERAVLEEDVDRFRDNVTCLDTSLKSDRWGCHCMIPHTASLRVGKPTPSRTIGLESTCCPKQSVCCGFDVLFSFQDQGRLLVPAPQWNWHETHFEPEKFVIPLASIPVNVIGGGSGTPPSPTSPSRVVGSSTEGQPPVPNKLKKRKKVHWSGSSTTQPPPATSGLQKIREIQSLCLELMSVREGAPLLGFLPAAAPLRLVVYPVKRHPRPIVASTDDMVNLADLLKRTGLQHNTCNTQRQLIQGHKKIEMRDRLYLAYVLSWIFLRLYGTSWLDKTWDPKDVQFLRRLDKDREPLLMEPFVSKSFPSPQHNYMNNSLPTPPDSDASSSSSNESAASKPILDPAAPQATAPTPTPWHMRHHNHGVYILGVSLIEVYFHKRLHEMYTPDDLDADGQVTEETPHLALERLMHEIRQEAGDRYGNAVRRCIKCQFDQWYDDINSPDFRQAFYQKVVVPLEANWKAFTHDSSRP